MKMLFALPLVALQFSAGDPTPFFSLPHKNDTTIVHILDGNIREWPKRKFMTDIDTEIQYAVDNDKQTLFLALNIPDTAIQKQITHQGMSLYIDTKGKKKETLGVEFPVKMENNNNPGNALNHMKLFGFTELAPFIQSTQIQGTVNIAAAWDSSSILTIEYNIPLSLLGKSVIDLNNKNIGIGWKINNSQRTKTNPNEAGRLETTVVGRSASGDVAPKKSAGLNKSSDPFPRYDTEKAQSFWTTHTIIL